MELTKHAHACVALDKGASHLVIDPGSFSSNAAELVAGTEVVLVTHEHFDHFDEELLGLALQERPELRVYGPAAVVDRWEARAGQVVAVAEGDEFSVAGFDISVFGAVHASIDPDIPLVANVGYLVDRQLYHPGDAYYAPPAPVSTLLVPTSGPWTKMGDAVDSVRAVNPQRAIQIHEIMLSEIGQQFTATLLSPDMLSRVPLEIVPVGATVDV